MRIPAGVAAVSLSITGAFLFFGLVVPLSAIAAKVAGGAGIFEPEVVLITGATLRQAVLSTLLSAALGLPLGLLVGSLDARARTRVLAWLRVPYGIPAVAAATAWVAWLGRKGILAPLGLDIAYSFSAVIVAHVFFNAPWIALLVAEARAEIPEPLLEAARTLGAGATARFRAVLWPSVRGALAAAAAQAFALCTMSFALVLVLGGGPPVDTLETSIYSHVRFGEVDLSGAAACALWELVMTLVPWVLVLLLEKPKVLREQPLRGPTRSTAGRGRLAWACALFFCVPYLAVFAPAALKALAGSDVLGDLVTPLVLSLALAALSAAGALVTSCAALLAVSWLSRRAGKPVATFTEIAVTLPAGISMLVLGLGAWLAYARFIDPLSGSMTAIVFLQVVLFTPLAFRALWPVAARMQPGLLEAAATLGAGPLRSFFAVEWPRWAGPLAGTAALISAASLGEVAAVSLFYSENLIPLPLVISRWMAQYRFAEAQGLAALLILIAAAVILTFGRGVSRA